MSQATDTALPDDVRGPESIPRAPVFGALTRAWRFRSHALEIVSNLYDSLGPVVLETIGPMKSVHLFGPEANEFVMLDRAGNFSARRSWNLIMGRIFPNGLLLRDGADHRHHRGIMLQAFTRTALNDYVDRMIPRIEERIDEWPARDPSFLAFPAFKELTFELAAMIFLGVEIGGESRSLTRAFSDTVAASMSILRLPLPGLEFNRGLRGREHMIGYLKGILGERRAREGPDMLSRLCHARSESGEQLDDQEIIDHMIFLMMAAHDTTTSTLTSIAYELGRHPEWQERVREECRALGGPPGWDEMQSLTATGLVTRETLRRYPPLSTVPRFSVREFEFGGYRVPANAMVAVYPLHTHHMAEWWREPFRFDPERFAPGRAEHQQHSHLWVPFGGGAHLCIGRRFAELQVKAVVSALVRRFRWSFPAGYAMPVQEAPISKPADGLPLSLEPLEG